MRERVINGPLTGLRRDTRGSPRHWIRRAAICGLAWAIAGGAAGDMAGSAARATAGGAGRPVSGEGEPAVTFRDVTKASGIRFTYRFDLKNGKMAVTQGGGAALADYDGDGRLDLYCVQSVANYKKPGRTGCGVLWHNEGPDARGIPRFRDVTAASGIRACGWGQGAYWVDIDGDGDPDLFQTNVGRNQLFVNRGSGATPRFEDRSLASGLGITEGLHVAAGFLDADRDGDVDVYVADYLVTDIERERANSGLDLKVPEDYEAAPKHYYRNEGRGAFVERTQEAGLIDEVGKSLGVAPYDYDGDGWTDLYVANDKTPNALFRNNHDGTFTNVAAENGCALDENGTTRSGMGLAVGDFDRDGRPDIFVSNFAPEWNTLYHGLGEGRFEDATGRSGLGPPSLHRVGWGTGPIDYDNDGRLDLYVHNGNIMPFWLLRLAKVFSHDKEKVKKYFVGLSYRQAPLLFRGRGDGTFEDTTASSGDLGRLRMVGRGSAAGDLDGDGDLDLFLVDTTGFPFGKRPSRVLLNDGGNRNHAVAFQPVPSADGRTVLGTKLVLESDGILQSREWQTQPSYASGSETPLWFGLGRADRADRLTVTWPDGGTTTHESVRAGAVWRIWRDGRIEMATAFGAR